MSDNLIVNLSKKIKYSYKGNPESETATLEFREAGMDEFNIFSSLKQLVMNSIMEATKFAPKGEARDNISSNDDMPQPNVSEIKAMLFSVKETQFSTIADKFKVLAKKTGTLDGETKITDGILNKLIIKDYENIICEYISYFLGASLFSNEE
jgi:hypothetical protein